LQGQGGGAPAGLHLALSVGERHEMLIKLGIDLLSN
jgi:hypothetical protein